MIVVGTEKDKHRRNEEDPRVLELFCQVCFQYLGVTVRGGASPGSIIHCPKCHENFDTPEAKQQHIALTGGCRFPGNVGLVGGVAWWLNDVGSVQWEPWSIPRKEDRSKSGEE